MKMLMWPYVYKDMRLTWKEQCNWTAQAFCDEGFEVLKHKDFKCDSFPMTREYSPSIDSEVDIVIYNHCDLSCLRPKNRLIKAKKTLFWKPTTPTPRSTAIDLMGFGPYSYITYHKPPFESIPDDDVQEFFEGFVRFFINRNENKWGEVKKSNAKLPDEYYLVLGQIPTDSVVTRHGFGDYESRLTAVIRELVNISDIPIVVKIHPRIDYRHKPGTWSRPMQQRLQKLDKKSNLFVYIGNVDVHSFLENAKCTFVANSGVGMEALLHHKPIITWDYPEYHWVSYDLRLLADLERALNIDEWYNRRLADKWIYWYMQKYSFRDLEGARRRVREIIRC